MDGQELDKLLAKLQTICEDHGVGGSLLVVSKEAAAFRQIIPDWVGLRSDADGLFLKINNDTREGLALARATVHFLGSMRDMSNDGLNLWGRIFRVVHQALDECGFTIDRLPFGGSGSRPDPNGGKLS